MNTPLTTSQDRQARNKPPPLPPPSSNPSSTNSKGKGKAPLATPHTSSSDARGPAATMPAKKSADEQFEERERRDQAARILGSREMLIWHAVANNESVPQTRLRFEKKMIGVDPEDSADEWEDELDDDDGSGSTSGSEGWASSSSGGSVRGGVAGRGLGKGKGKGKGKGEGEGVRGMGEEGPRKRKQ